MLSFRLPNSQVYSVPLWSGGNLMSHYPKAVTCYILRSSSLHGLQVEERIQ